VQNMEPSAEQYRLASMLESTSDQEKESEQKIQKVVEFTGCTSDQAAIALFDTDFNVEAACLKILESAENEAAADTWGKVEKPQKKVLNRDEKMDKFGNDFQVSGHRGDNRGGARGRGAFRGGRGDFRGGRGGGAQRGKSYDSGRFPDRSFGDYQGGNKRDYSSGRGGGGGQRGGARGGGSRGGGGGYRGRSEPPRGGQGRSGYAQRGQSRQHQAPTQHAGSDSGSDWGQNEPEWGKTEKWDAAPVKHKQAPPKQQTVAAPTRTRVDSSGWDEPESLNAQNWTRKDSEGWNDDGDNWGQSATTVATQKQEQKTQKTQKWNETYEWGDNDQSAKQAWTDDEPKKQQQPAVVSAPKAMPSHAAVVNASSVAAAAVPPVIAQQAAAAPVAQQQQQQAAQQQTDHLDRIFSKNVNILDTQKNISSSTVKPHRKQQNEEKSIPQNNQLPPGFATQQQQQRDVLSFGRSPERGGRRAPPPIRSSINHPRQAVEMPTSMSVNSDLPTAQFCFGSFPEPSRQSAPVSVPEPVEPQVQQHQQQEPLTEYTNGESKSVTYPAHPNTATSQPDQGKDLDHGLSSYHHQHIPTREKAERDLRKMLNQPSSKDSSHSSSSTMGQVVPGLINPVQPQSTNQGSVVGSVQRPNQSLVGASPPQIYNKVKNEIPQSALPSAPGQGRLNIDRNQQQPTQRAYQPSISTADMGLHYGGMSSNPTYDILGHPMGQGRPISSRPDELRTSSQQQQQQAPQMNQPSQYQYQHTPMQPFYANLGMPYYPVIGQRNPNAFQPTSMYHNQQSSMGGTNSSDSLRGGMRNTAGDIATPPPFGAVPNLSPHTYPSGVAQQYNQYEHLPSHHPSAPVAFPQLLIQQPTAGSLGGQHINMGHHQQDNRGPRQNL